MRLQSKVMNLAKPLKKGTSTATKKVKSVVSRTKQAVKKSNGDLAGLREQVKLERARVSEAKKGVTAANKAVREAVREHKNAERQLAKALKAVERAGGKPRGRPTKT